MFRYLIVVFLILLADFSFGQVVLPTQDHTDATIGLDRKDWDNGNTGGHSEGYAHDFTLPARTNPCEQITGISVEINITDYSNVGPCSHGILYYNLFYGCDPYTGGASCSLANLLVEVPYPPNTAPPPFNFGNGFDFGENLSVDIVPADGCQDAVTNGEIRYEYTITVTVTVIDNPALTIHQHFFLWEPNPNLANCSLQK